MKWAVDRLTAELALTDEQRAKLEATMAGAWSNQHLGSGTLSTVSGRAIAETERRLLERLKQAATAIVTDAQRSAFEAWIRELEPGVGRGNRRDAIIWVLDRSGELDVRQVRIGLADDDFAELQDGLHEGDRVVTRAREKERR